MAHCKEKNVHILRYLFSIGLGQHSKGMKWSKGQNEELKMINIGKKLSRVKGLRDANVEK